MFQYGHVACCGCLQVDNPEIRDKWVAALKAVVTYNKEVLAMKTEDFSDVADVEAPSRLRSKTFSKRQAKDERKRVEVDDMKETMISRTKSQTKTGKSPKRQSQGSKVAFAPDQLPVPDTFQVDAAVVAEATFTHQLSEYLPPVLEASSPPTLPHPWQSFQDPQGDTYYYNPDTGETSWELPEHVATQAYTYGAQAQVYAQEPMYSPEETYAEEQAYEEQAYQEQAYEEQGDLPPVVGSHEQATHLPHPWQAFQDDQGDTYYYNPDTEETSWDYPTA